MPRNDGENIIEIMSHAGGEPSYRLHFLGLTQLLFTLAQSFFRRSPGLRRILRLAGEPGFPLNTRVGGYLRAREKNAISAAYHDRVGGRVAQRGGAS